MNTYYSILFTQIRPAINEQISIALLLANENKVLFDFSSEKLNILRKFFPNSTVIFLQHYLQGIKNKAKELAFDNIPKGQLFIDKTKEYRFFQQEYLSYLNNYSNNLVTFSNPSRISVDVNELNFNSLFHKYISIESPIVNEISQIKKAKYELLHKVKDKVNVEVKLNELNIPQIKIRSILPDEIDIFGKNENYLSTQFIDFEKKDFSLRASLSLYINFAKELGKSSTNYIVGNEPNSSLSKNHLYWKEISELDDIKLIPTSDIAVIENHIDLHNVQKVL